MAKGLYVATGTLIALLFSPLAHAASSEMEVLLKLLEKKGVLTSSEAQSLVKETKEVSAKETAEANKASVEKEATKGWLPPEWLKNTKVKGDLRLRGEIADRAETTAGTRERERYRLRVGAETKITDEVMVGFGLGSGEYASTSAGANGNARSANQTMTDSFTRKPIWIDYAYAKYQPANWFSIMGGKFMNPVWQPSDFLLSNDINPEGAAIKLSKTVSPYIDLFFDGAFYLLSERSSDPDALMYVAQPGMKINFTKDSSLKLTAAYYWFDNVTRFAPLTGTTSTNSLASGKYRYEYNTYVFGGELGFNNPFGLSSIPYAGIIGGYVTNPDPSKDNKAYLAGFNLGHPSLTKFGDWNVEYTYRRYEKDALLDIFPGSSFYSGTTNAMGHRVKTSFGLAKNTSVGLSYYNTWSVRPTRSASNRNGNPAVENLGQIDFVFKF